MDPPSPQILIFDIWDGKLGCLTGEILCEIESLPNIEILFNIFSLPNIAIVRTYYSAWRVCGPSSQNLKEGRWSKMLGIWVYEHARKIGAKLPLPFD